MKVEVISKETIKPSSPTPDHLRHHKLSFLDQIQPPVYMPLVLFYPKIGDAKFSNLQQCDRTKKSLSEVLTLFYPLAGRINGNLYIDCNDEGVHYVEAEAKCKLSEFLDDPNLAELNKFLPYELDDASELPIAIQVTFFNCGGLVMGLIMSHKVSDALSCIMFLNTWTAIARGDSSNIVSPQFHSATLFPPRALSGFDPTTGIIKENIVTKRFVFDASSIASMRAKYSTDDKNIEYPRPSRVEALSAFIWSRYMAATQPKADPHKIYTVIHAVNLRTRTEPSIPNYYFGNYSRIAVSVPSRDTKDGFYGIIKPVRDAIKKVDAEYVKKLQKDNMHLNYLKEKAERFMEGEVVSFAITSLCRFPLYEVDFGWGKPAWVTTAKMTFKNLVSFFDTKSGDGIEAWINLKEEDMAKLETDEELSAYVSRARNCSGQIAKMHLG
jgi:shikimate O-hydroxycinnamoyltransferase|uniref:Vinorine synthase-like n=1 Tax=Fagus sylvatica TaxID=28930 RepID=A0A2N9IAH1_FAGSY